MLQDAGLAFFALRRYPGGLPAVNRYCRASGGLAKAGWGRDQGELMLQALIQSPQQRLARNERRMQMRGSEFRAQEFIGV